MTTPTPNPPAHGQLLVYSTEDGRIKIDVRLEGETVWLTQAHMAELFRTSVPNINMHLRNIFAEGELQQQAVIQEFLITAADGKAYRTKHYNLDAIISVGYRIKSAVATRFRIWATQRLREFIVKGFVLDDERLKNPDQPFDYFDELLRRIQDIRTSERRFYQKITDIYATSIDYDPTRPESIEFFQTVQNKMHWAITGQTAAEIIHARADGTKAVAFGSTEFIVLRSRTLTPEFVYLLARSDEFRGVAIKSMSGATGRQRVEESAFDQELKKVIFSHVGDAERLQKKSLDELIAFKTAEARNTIQILKDELHEINEEIVRYEEAATAENKKRIQNLLGVKKGELEAHEKTKPAEVAKPENDPVKQNAITQVSVKLEKAKEEVARIERQIAEAEKRRTEVLTSIAVVDRLLARVENLKRQLEAFSKESKADLANVDMKEEEIITVAIDVEPLNKKRQQYVAAKDTLSATLDPENRDGLEEAKKKGQADVEQLRATLDEPNKQYQAYQAALTDWQKQKGQIIGNDQQSGSIKFYEQQLKDLEAIPRKLQKERASRLVKAKEINTVIRQLADTYRELYAPVNRFIEQRPLAREKFHLNFEVGIVDSGFEDGFFEIVSHGVAGTFCGVEEGYKALKQISQGDDNVILMYIEFGMAQKYVDDLSRNVKRGLRAKVEQGWYPSYAPLGYMNCPIKGKGQKELVKDPERFPIVRRMWNLLLKGGTPPPQILDRATKLWGLRSRPSRKSRGEAFSRSGIYRVFTNPFYYGWFEFPKGSGQWYKGRHEPMVSKSEFDRAQSLLQCSSNPRPKQPLGFSFTGMIQCGSCGSGITAEEKHQVICSNCRHKFAYRRRDACPRCATPLADMKKPLFLQYVYYHCTRKKDPACKERSVSQEALERQIQEKIARITISEKFRDYAIKHLHELHDHEIASRNTDIDNHHLAYKNCVRRIDNLVALKTSPLNRAGDLLTDEEYLRQRVALLQEKDRLEELMQGNGHRIVHWLTLAEKTFEFACAARDAFQNGSVEDKKQILLILGSNLTLSARTLNIEAKKPFIILEEALYPGATGDAAFEPKKTLTKQGRKGAFASSRPTRLPRWDDVRTYEPVECLSARSIYTFFRTASEPVLLDYSLLALPPHASN